MTNPIAVVAMPRTGHHAVMNWLEQKHKVTPRNMEGFFWREAMKQLYGKPTVPILVVRDFRNWCASMVHYFRRYDTRQLMRYTDAWMTHVEQMNRVPTIVYHDWVRAGHGDDVEGAGSYFDDDDYLNRYKYIEDRRYDEMMQRTDALDLNERAFGDLYDLDEVAA